MQGKSERNAMICNETVRTKLISNIEMLLFYKCIYIINSSPPIAAYMRQWIVPALLQMMICRLFSTKPFSCLLSIGPSETNFGEISIKIQQFSFKKMRLKISSDKLAAILSSGRWVNVLRIKQLKVVAKVHIPWYIFLLIFHYNICSLKVYLEQFSTGFPHRPFLWFRRKLQNVFVQAEAGERLK